MPIQPTAVLRSKRPRRTLVYLLAFLALIMSVRSVLEHHFLYFPHTHHETTPARVGLNYTEVDFPAADGTQLSGWLVPGQHGAPIVLFCMGNAGNISHRLETLQLLHDLGVATFIFNYRGYGLSQGTASENGTYQDVTGAMTWLRQHGWTADRVIIFGRSLGAAVGLEAALHEPPAGLIMESAFTSIPAMGRVHYPLLNRLLGWLIDAKYDNLSKIGALQSPLLLIHGRADTICPPSMATELYARAASPKRLHWIDGANHNNGFVLGGVTYREVLRQVITDWTGASPPGMEKHRKE